MLSIQPISKALEIGSLRIIRWITGHYPVSAGMSVLELGCGTGAAWLNQREIIDACSRIILTDFSEGMLAKAKETLK